jgi:putative transposase
MKKTVKGCNVGDIFQSMRFPASTTIIKSFEAIKDGFIKLPKMNVPIQIVVHQEFTGRPVSFTVSRTPSMEYYVSILVEEEVVLKPATHREVGIDLGLTDLIITSDGIKFQRVSRQLEKTNQLLKKAQKKLAKKEKGSKSYERARIRVARLYARITRIRNDYYHNISAWLVLNYDAIYVENLNVNGMLKNHRMARAIQEAAWSTLVSMISYKSIWYGKTFHQIDRWYPSSKTCSCCGHKVDKLPLDIREWTCPNCGSYHDRDINAAINIKNQGQLDCYEQLLDQFWSDGIADRGSWIPVRLGKYASKTERSKTPVLVGIGTDEDTRSLVVY